MKLFARCSLFVTFCSLLVARCSLLVTFYPLLFARFFLLVAFCSLLVSSALEFQHCFPRQIKCRGNYIKCTLPRQCFCRGWQDFILRASVFTSATLAKTSTRSKLVRLLPLLHISRRIRSIMRTIIVMQIFLYKYCYM